MAEWEVHYLRGLVAVMLAKAILAKRRGESMNVLVARLKRARRRHQAAQLRALNDPEFRAQRSR